MATKVVGELYESITGKIFELGRQLRQKSGYPFDPVKLDNYLQLAVEGQFGDAFPFLHDRRRPNWSLLEDNPRTVALSRLGLAVFMEEFHWMNSSKIERRSQEMSADFGQKQAEILLLNQSTIPDDWRQFHLIFPGTVWEDPFGFKSVPMLIWDSPDGWRLKWLSLSVEIDGVRERLLKEN